MRRPAFRILGPATPPQARARMPALGLLPVAILPVAILPVTILLVAVLLVAAAPAAAQGARMEAEAGAGARAAGGDSQTDSAAGPRTLTIGVTQFPSTFHPHIDSMLAKSYILGLARRGIATYGPDWQPQCLLCRELPSLEAGTAEVVTDPAGRETLKASYEIRPQARWGDGTPVTTDDILFTWRAMRRPESGASNLELFAEDITDIERHGPRRFTLHFDKKLCDFQAIGAFRPLPAHLEKPIFEADPGRYRQQSLYNAEPTRPGLYNGPYVISEIAPGSFVELTRNPHWWGARPEFDRIIVRVIENTAALTANLLAGEIDMIAGELGLTLDQALAFRKAHPDRFRYIFKPGLVYEHIDLRLDHPALADRDLRRALIHASDRRGLSEQLFQGEQPVAHSPVSPLDPGHSDAIPTYEHDPARARALLDRAGWRRQGRWRVDEAGERLRLVFQTTAGNRTREMVQQFLQTAWRELGIDVRIANEPARVLFGRTLSKRRFEGMAMYAWISAPGSIPRSTLHSGRIPREANGYSGQNYPGYANPRMDEALDALETVCAPGPRQALWDRVQTLYARDLPALPLFWRANAFILPRWLTGVTPTGHLAPTTLWVEKWGVDRSARGAE